MVALIAIIVIVAIVVLISVWGVRGCLTAFGATFGLIVSVLVVLYVIVAAVDKFTAWRDSRQAEETRRVEEQKAKDAEEAEIAEVKRRQEAKDEKIQAFALKEAPKVWEVYQSLQGEIDVQNGKIEELRKSLETFGRTPEEDTDFVRICALRDEMKRSREALRAKLEDAYIAAKKYEAAPSRKDYQELHKKALEDGILEADAASARFKEMRRNK